LTRPETTPRLFLGILLIFLGLLPIILGTRSSEPLPTSFYLLEYLLIFGLVASGLMAIFRRRAR
jgi:hypothetical protein